MTTMTTETKYAEKIAKLLNQAENAGATPAEAEAFMQRAAQLMLEYAISEAMIDAVRGIDRDELVQENFDYTGVFQYGTLRVGSAVAAHFGLRCVQSLNNPGSPKYSRLYVVGFKSDVARARLLDTSLQVQCAAAHQAWYKENKESMSWMDKGLVYRTRRDFVFGFASGVGAKLSEASRAARVEAKAHEAERAEVTLEAASASVELVLVGRKKRVEDYYDTVWGGKTRSSSTRYRGGSSGGRGAGYSAGLAANTNTGAGIGSRGVLGR